MGRWWPVAIQIHGHAQVFGWLGLFIIGVSLFFLPRFAGVPLRFPSLPRWICLLMVLGIVARSIALLLLNLAATPFARALLGLSGLLEITAIGLYVALLYFSMRGADSSHRAIHAVRPFFAGVLVGWILSISVLGLLAIHTAWVGSPLPDPDYNQLGYNLFTGLVLLPIAFAISIRTFPLYLRLPAVRWPVRRFAQLYFLTFALETLPVVLRLIEPGLAETAGPFHAFGRLCKGVLLASLVWRLDLLTRRRMPWTAEREGEPPAARRSQLPLRPHLPDHGEFGRFERLLYLSYAWLFCAGLLEIYSGTALLSGLFAPFDPHALRHVYLGGYGSLLLFGMAPRMIPGFMHIRRLAYPHAVDLTFYLAGAAALFRILPYLLPPALATMLPGRIATYLFGLSGALGWLAVAVLAANLWVTMRRSPS